MIYGAGSVSPPPCFGTGYDNDSPRCLACSFQYSCRQTVVSQGVQRMSYAPQYAPVGAVQPPQQYYQTAPAPAPYIPPPPPAYAQQSLQYRPQPWQPPPPPQPPPQYRVPVQQAPVPQQQQVGQPVASWAPVHFQIPQSLEYSRFGYYGYYPDQMWASVASVAPVWRPQQPGETFGTRVIKNMGLILLEHAFQQLMFATRQAFLPPGPRQLPASQQTVEIPG
jgi:hypothetical protein